MCVRVRVGERAWCVPEWQVMCAQQLLLLPLHQLKEVFLRDDQACVQAAGEADVV